MISIYRRKDPHYRYVGQAVNAEKHDLYYDVDAIQKFIDSVQGQLEQDSSAQDLELTPEEEEDYDDDEEEPEAVTAASLKAKKKTVNEDFKMLEQMRQVHSYPQDMATSTFEFMPNDVWESVLRGIYGKI